MDIRSVFEGALYTLMVAFFSVLILGFVVRDRCLYPVDIHSLGFLCLEAYFLELLGPDFPMVMGVIAALVSLATIMGNSLVELFTRICSKRTALLLKAAGVQSLAAIGVGLSDSF